METADLSKAPVVFHDVLVDSPSVFIVDNDADEENLDVIFKPFKGGAEKKEKDEGEKKSKKKDDDVAAVEIDKLQITGTKLQYGPIPIPMIPQTLTFTDIGKKSENSHTLKDLYETGVKKVKSAAGGLGKTLDKINPANLLK